MKGHSSGDRLAREKKQHIDDDTESLTSGANDTEQSPRDVHGIKWFLVVAGLISATFLWGLDGTITADMQATFVRDFNSIEKLAYNSVAFFLGAAACVLTW
jgi:hypothetical protein